MLHLPLFRFHCVGRMLGSNPGTVAILASAVSWCSNHSATSHPPLFFKISCCAALPSKRLKLKKEGAVQPVGRILSKKQRKRLEKIVDVKKKKENRAQLLKVSTYNSWNDFGSMVSQIWAEVLRAWPLGYWPDVPFLCFRTWPACKLIPPCSLGWRACLMHRLRHAKSFYSSTSVNAIPYSSCKKMV